jgi:hypothetical protein
MGDRAGAVVAAPAAVRAAPAFGNVRYSSCDLSDRAAAAGWDR